MAETRRRLSVSLSGDTLTTGNDHFQVTYSLNSGTWDYMDRTGYTIVKNAYAKALLNDSMVLSTLEEGKRWFAVEEFEDEISGTGRRLDCYYQPRPGEVTLKVTLFCYHTQPYMVLQTSLDNTSPDPVTVQRLNLIEIASEDNRARGGVYLGSEPTQYNVFLNSCAPTPTGFQAVYDGFTTEQVPAHENRSDGIIYDKLTERALVFGFLSFKKWWSSIQVGYNADRQASKNQRGVNTWSMYHQCNMVCPPGGEIASEPVYINFAASASEAQSKYADLLAQYMQVRKPPNAFASWSPAYLSPDSLSEAVLIEQLNWLKENQERYPKLQSSIEYIHVPHGWQKQPGSLDVDRERFPNGLRWISERIHEVGFKASVHLAPYYVSMSQPFFKQCRPFLIREDSGRVMQVEVPEQEEPVALLDPSHPEAQAYLSDVFTTVAGEWGYDLLAVDLLGYTQGMHTATATPRYHDPELSSVEIYRAALRIALDAIEAQEREILLFPHCGACATGLDMLPVSTLDPAITAEEIIPIWSARMGMRQRVRSWAARQYLNGTVSLNDVGVLRLAQPRPLNEAIIGLTAALLNGGLLTLGDEWSKLDQDRIEVISRALPLLGKPCRVLDVYSGSHPTLWHLPLGDVDLLALFNWTDDEQDIRLDFERLQLSPNQSYLAYDFWGGQLVGSFQRSIELQNVPARSVRLLGIRAEENMPQFLNINTHVGQGTLELLSSGWDTRSESLLGVCSLGEKADATLSIHVPSAYLPTSVACFGAHYSYQWHRPLYEIRLSRGEGLVHFSVHFGRASG